MSPSLPRQRALDKKDYEDSLSEYALASEVGSLRLFALINRGNALKALGLAEAIAIYQDVLDEAGLDTVDGRLVHSFAYNNLGAACQDAGRLEQSLQHLQSAVSLNKNCYLAIRNRANVHMHLATNLQKTAQPSLLPPQHETAWGLYAKAMETTGICRLSSRRASRTGRACSCASRRE